jgi:hypothetical protein
VLLAFSACGSSGPTGIVVEVTSDLAVPPDAEFHLRISAADGRLLREFPFRSADLPARLSLVPARAATTVTVEATAPLDPPLSRRATVSFRSGSLLLLRLPLEAACVCVPCPTDRTCEAGRCADPLKDVTTLPAYAPRAAGRGPTVAVPVCSGEAGAPSNDGADGALPRPTDAFVDGAGPSSSDGSIAPGSDAGAPDAGTANPDLPPAAPDLAADATSRPDVPGPMPDASVDLPPPPDSATPPDLPSLRSEGQPCSTSDQCLSNACVDHVCCRNACVGACLACDSVHTGVSSGQCAPVLAGTDPDNDCAADVPMSCGYDGLCNGAGACRLYPASTLCAAATCNTASSYTPARNCTGAGACAPPVPQSCGLFLCKPSGCPVTCQTQGDCTATAYCNGSACVAKKPALQPCAAAYECLSGSCLATCL